MSKIISRLLQFLGIMPNYRSKEFLDKITALEHELELVKKTIITHEEDNHTLLTLATIYTKKNENMHKGMQALAGFLDSHTKEIKEIYKLIDQHAKVINDNMNIFKNYLQSEGVLEQFVSDDSVKPPEPSVEKSVADVLKMLDRSPKKDFGKN